MRLLLLEFSAAFALLVRGLRACYLHGSNVGECTTNTLDPVWRATYMPFCFDAVTYPACIPKYIVLPPSREFPLGRWHNNTAYNKDQWIEQSVTSHMIERIGYEKNKTMNGVGGTNRNEFGDIGHTRKRFTLPNGQPRLDCQLAFKNYFCWINFPRCDVTLDQTLPTCKSACENFFRVCNYENGLWRCGKSKWFNGYEPDKGYTGQLGDHSASYPNTTYLREYFPGQPFRKNKYTTMGVEVPICTPAVLGAAPGRTGSGATHLAALLVGLVGTLLAARREPREDE